MEGFDNWRNTIRWFLRSQLYGQLGFKNKCKKVT